MERRELQELMKGLSAEVDFPLLEDAIKSVSKALETASEEEEAAQHTQAFLLFARHVAPEAFAGDLSVELPDTSLEKDDESGWETHLKNLMADQGFYHFGNIKENISKHFGVHGWYKNGYKPDARGIHYPHAQHEEVHGRGSGNRTLMELTRAFAKLHPEMKLPSWNEMLTMTHEQMIDLASKHGYLPQTRGGTLNVVDPNKDGKPGKAGDFKRRAFDVSDHASAPERGAGKNLTQNSSVHALARVLSENKNLEDSGHKSGKAIRDKSRQLGTISRHDTQTHSGPRSGHGHMVSNPEQSGAAALGNEPGTRGYGAHDPHGDLKDQPKMDSLKWKAQQVSQKAKAKVTRALSPKVHQNQITPAAEPKAAPAKPTPPKKVPAVSGPNFVPTGEVKDKPKEIPAPAAPAAPGPIKDYSAKKLTVSGSAGGTNDAKFATDEHGKKWLVKQYGGDANRVATELASNAIYREMGANTPEAGHYTPDGKAGIAYPALEGESKNFSNSEELGKHYMTDALLANWDVIGASKDNILWSKDGKPIRIDQGGTLQYRAKGAKKDFGPVPAEVNTMLLDGQAKGNVKVSYDGLKQQAADISQKLTPEKIHEIVNSAGFENSAMKHEVEKNLNARVQWMAKFANGEVDIAPALKTQLGASPTPEAAPKPIAPATPKPAKDPKVTLAHAAKKAAAKHVKDLMNSSDPTSKTVGAKMLEVLNSPEKFDPSKVKASGNTARAAAQNAMQGYITSWESAGKPSLPYAGPLTAEEKAKRKQAAAARADAKLKSKVANSKFAQGIKGKSKEEQLKAHDDLVTQLEANAAKQAALASAGKTVPKAHATEANRLRSQVLTAQQVLANEHGLHAKELQSRAASVRNKAKLERVRAPQIAAQNKQRAQLEKLTKQGLATKLQDIHKQHQELLNRVVADVAAGKSVSLEALAKQEHLDGQKKLMAQVLRDKHGYTASQLGAARNKGKAAAGVPLKKPFKPLSAAEIQKANTDQGAIKVFEQAKAPLSEDTQTAISSWMGGTGTYKSYVAARLAHWKETGKGDVSILQLMDPEHAAPGETPYVQNVMDNFRRVFAAAEKQKPLSEPVINVRAAELHQGIGGFTIEELKNLVGKDIVEREAINGSLFREGAKSSGFYNAPIHAIQYLPAGAKALRMRSYKNSMDHEEEILPAVGAPNRVVEVVENVPGSPYYHPKWKKGTYIVVLQQHSTGEADPTVALRGAKKLLQTQERAKLRETVDRLNGVKRKKA